MKRQLKKKKYDKIKKAQAKARGQALTYNKMRRELGEYAPISLNEYIKIKFTDIVKYNDLVEKAIGLLAKDKDVKITKTNQKKSLTLK